jgi:hypothetical protein
VGDVAEPEGAGRGRDSRGDGGDGDGFVSHPIHESLANAKDQPPNTLLVSGYLKVSKDKATAQVFLDLTLRTYYYVDRTQVLYVGDPDPSDATKATPILLDTSVPLTLVQTTDASYLRGHIASSHPVRAMKSGDGGITSIIEQLKTCVQGVFQGGVIFTRCPTEDR